MNKLEQANRLSGRWHPLVSIIYILLFTLIGFLVVGPLLGSVLALPFFEGGLLEIQQALGRPLDHPEIKTPLFIIQGFATLLGFVAIPIFYLKVLLKKDLGALSSNALPTLFDLLIIPVIVLVFMVVNAWFIEWNENIVFPEFMGSFGDWARQREDYLGEVTEFLTQFNANGQLVVALIVVAVLPGIGEELVFRGFIQRHFFEASGNIHLGIWASAILFSAFHIQFFGFVPRMLLGALFGYLYFWSGNLWAPILAHIFNNGFSLIMIYLHQNDVVEFDIEDTQSVSVWQVLVFSLITGVLLYFFRKHYQASYGQVAKGV